jgi:hypothetical protein
MRNRVLAGIFLFASALFGQLGTNAVTVTASNTASLQPDQILYSIQVSSGLGASLSDVVAAVQGLGITSANFTGIGTVNTVVNGQPTQNLTWFFSLAAPLTSSKATIAQITAVQQTIAAAKNGFSLSFTVQGTQVSQQLQQSQSCVLSSLLAQARTQAQSLATAAGFKLDAVQAMSSTVTTSVSGQGQNLSSFLLGAGSAPCTATVKFGLNHNQ